MKYVVSVGGGISSTLLLPMELIWNYKISKDQLDFVMCKLPNEDADVFKLIEKVNNLLGIEIKFIGHNKTPFDIFNEVKFLGNSRIDPCSRILKREVMRDYMKENYPNKDATVCVGINLYEIDRMLSIEKRWKELGYPVLAPLENYVGLDREQQIALCKDYVGFVPKLYLMGFSHNNCGGACIKAGKKEWARLWYFIPETYTQWENDEQAFRELNGDYSILREMRQGIKYSLTLKEFRERLENEVTRPDKEEKYIDSFEQTAYFQNLDPTPACSFCDAMA